MPDGVDIRGRNWRDRRDGDRNWRDKFPRSGFPEGWITPRRFPRFYFSPISGTPRRRCEYTDRFGRCCDRYGRCYYDGFRGGYPSARRNDSEGSRYGSRNTARGYRRDGQY